MYDSEISLTAIDDQELRGPLLQARPPTLELSEPCPCGGIPHKGSVPLDLSSPGSRLVPWGGRQWGAATEERGGNAPLYHIPYSSPPLQESSMGRPHRRICRQCNDRATSRRLYVGWPHPPLFTTVTVDLCGPCWRSYTDIMCTLGPAVVQAPPAWVQPALTGVNA